MNDCQSFIFRYLASDIEKLQSQYLQSGSEGIISQDERCPYTIK